MTQNPIKTALLCHIQKFREVQLRSFNIAICGVNDHIYIYRCIEKNPVSNQGKLEKWFDAANYFKNDHNYMTSKCLLGMP